MSEMKTATAGELASKHCRPCEKGTPPLPADRVAALLKQLPGWEQRATGGGEIAKTFPFKNYYETMAFVNAAAWVSHREDHHPDLEVGYNKCKVRYSTHSVGGLSENDFICAAKLEALFRI
jgi:4a-hydroxytetrahydrobiopterin dehydratase